MKNYVICIILFLIFNSPAFSAQSPAENRMLKKKLKFDSSNLDVRYNEIYKHLGTYKCAKDFKIISGRMESTADGKYQDFMFIYKDGKVLFFGKTIFKGYENYVKKPEKDFNAVLFQRNNMNKIQRIQVYHPILGMDFGNGTQTMNIAVQNNQVIIKSTVENCDIYELFDDKQ